MRNTIIFINMRKKLIYRYLCGKYIRRKELSKIPELHKFHKYHEWYDYIEKKYGNCSLEGLIEFWHFLNQKSRNVKPKYEYWTLCIPVGLTLIVNEIFDLTLKFSDIKNKLSFGQNYCFCSLYDCCCCFCENCNYDYATII